uniref:FBD domain-containing protein n=1 Tax=Brassica campestris TaxID=3711 RepID=M4E5M8_BRACM
MRTPSPPSLLSLTVNTALLNISRINDLSHLPEHIVLELFERTLKAGKLNERVLRVFMGTGNEEVLAIIAALKIKIDLSPIVPTRCDEKFRMNWSRR